MSDCRTSLDKLNEAIKASWDKNNGPYPKDFAKWYIHEQAFLDGMQYAVQAKTDRTYTMPDNPDPKFYRDILIGLFAPREYDNPTGREILGEEFDKAIEELKNRLDVDALKDPNVSLDNLSELKEKDD